MLEYLDSSVAALRAAGVQFRSGMIEGVGARQVIIEVLSGNPVELFSPLRAEGRLEPS